MNGNEHQRQVDALTGGLNVIRELRGVGGHYALQDRLRLEGKVWDGPAFSISAGAYLEAAGLLSGRGYEREAATLERLAATDPEIQHAAWEWETRLEGPGPFTVSGVRGIDGVSYAETRTADGELAVLAAGIPAVPEIVTGFAGAAERAEWIADRTLSQLDRADLPPETADLPLRQQYMARFPSLASCVSGPSCRTALEEQVLARILRDGDQDGQLVASLTHRMFTSHVRAEIYAAWCEAAAKIVGDGTWPREFSVVSIALDRRIQRAPDWGLEATGIRRLVGEPAVSYMNRLVVTPVTREQAAGAVTELVAEQTQTTAATRGARTGSARTHAARPVPGPRRGEMPDARWRVPQQRRPDDPSPGPVPRL